ncbi:MAG: F0F1 ATP synthase subunit delta [Isosphaerales bacterium]
MQAREEATKHKEQLNSQLRALDQQRHELIRQAREQAEAERKAALADAECAVQRRREEVEQQLKRDRDQVLEALRTELIQSAVTLAERFLHEASDSTLQRQLAGRLVATLQQIPETERQQLRRDWQADDSAIVETTADLNGQVLESLESALESLAGRKVSLSLQMKPALVGGLRVRLGGHVWDASLADAMRVITTGCLPERPAHDHARRATQAAGLRRPRGSPLAGAAP